MPPHDPLAAGLLAHKVLNNNVVIVVDSEGRERVLMGLGLGFQLKRHDVVDQEKIEKTFILATGAEGDRERRLLTDVAYPIIEAVGKAVDDAERTLGHNLDRHFTMAIVDHIQFVLQRLAEGVRIPAANMPEMRILHPLEFEAASGMAASISRSLAVELPQEEALFLAMHLLNRTREETHGSASLLFRRVQHVVKTIERNLGRDLDSASADYARFVLHIQFLLQRMVSKTMLKNPDGAFFDFAKQRYPAAYDIATEVDDYVVTATGARLTDEEMLYVVVHVERLRANLEAADTGAQPS